MNIIDELTEVVAQFCDERDWAQFHNGKDLACAISIESTELLEAFLWKKAEEVDVTKVKEELADVIMYALLMARQYDLDIPAIVNEKLLVNAAKYPADKVKGSARKYNEI